VFFFKSQNYPARLCLNLVLGKNSGGQRTHKLGNVVLLSETVKNIFFFKEGRKILTHTQLSVSIWVPSEAKFVSQSLSAPGLWIRHLYPFTVGKGIKPLHGGCGFQEWRHKMQWDSDLQG